MSVMYVVNPMCVFTRQQRLWTRTLLVLQVGQCHLAVAVFFDVIYVSNSA